MSTTNERLDKAKDKVSHLADTIQLLDRHLLLYLLNKGTITQDQFTAGEQFYRDWYLSTPYHLRATSYEPKIHVAVPILPTTDRQMHHSNRYHSALRRLGYRLSRVMQGLVLTEITIEDYLLSKNLPNIPRRRAEVIFLLKEALTDLAKFYSH